MVCFPIIIDGNTLMQGARCKRPSTRLDEYCAVTFTLSSQIPWFVLRAFAAGADR